MKSRKNKTLPVRAKRYQKKRNQNLDYNNLEQRNLLAADLAPTLSFVGNTDLINLSKPVPLAEGVDLLRDQLELGRDESLKLQKSWSDNIGFEHFKYQQYYNNVLVEGSNYTLHVKNSQIVSMSGDRVQLTEPVMGVTLASETALHKAMEHIGAELYAWQDEFTSMVQGIDGAPEGELVYITGDDGTSIPTYKIDMYALDLGTRDYVYVNAHTGVIEATESRIRDQDIAATGESQYNGTVSFIADQVGSSEFRLRQVTDGVETFDNNQGAPGDFTTAFDITSSSPYFDAPIAFSGVSAHWGAENVLSMLEDWFGRDSYDDQGAVLTSYVNVNFFNASWNGSVMQYGEGDGVNFGPLVEIDIVGHEITHGVNEYSANLVYANEPGALSESFSDIFGEVVDYYATGTNDWVAGDQVDIQGNGIRNYMDPNEDGDPDTYLGDFWQNGGGDNGGVHTNSGVQNHWFYILSEGLAGTNDNGEDYDVTGIGIEDAAQIAYRSLNVYLGVNSQYQDARDASVQAAIDIYGELSPERQATHEAWEAVGVYSLDIIIDQLTEVVPGSMIFTAETSSEIPPVLDRGVVLELDAGQALTVVVEADSNVAPTLELVDPNGTVIATAGANGNLTSFENVAITMAGTYRIGVDTANGVVGDFDIRIVLNGSLESELFQSFDNGQQSTAQDIEGSALTFDAISADRLGVTGEFEISEIPSLVGYDFEFGGLDGSWTTSSTHVGGRIQVLDSLPAGQGDFALYMDTVANGFENLNEAIWSVDLSSFPAPFLNFYFSSYNDENTELPVAFNGTLVGDGVSVSEDGVTWYTILTDSVTDPGDWHQFTINLADVAATTGIELTSTFQIKFQQFDDDELGADGRGYDGISITSTAESEDWYSFDLTAGDVATIAVGQVFESGYVNLELFNSSGDLILAGTPSTEIASRINQFVVTETDKYFARLIGSATPYGLVVTRGADFDIGSAELTPQDITLPQSVIGYVDTVANTTADPDAAADKQILDNFFDGVTLSNNVTGGSVYAVRASFEAPSGANVFGPTETGASGWQGGVDELRADFAILQRRVSILVGAEESAEDVGFLRAYNVDGVEIGRAFSRPLEPGETQRIRVFSPSRQIAYIVAGGFQNDVTPLDDLRYEAPLESNDVYSIDAVADQLVTVNATFPGGGPLLFDNGLIFEDFNGSTVIQLRMEVVNSNGQVIANGKDSVSFYSEGGGTFVVRVSAAAGEGNYHLGFTTETDIGRTPIGPLGLGVAVDDAATGKGYLMFTYKSVFNRFFKSPPLAGSAEHVVAVRYDRLSQSWQYNNDQAWISFTTTLEDRLIAIVDFDADEIYSLEGLSGDVYGIPQGFGRSDLQFNANVYNSTTDIGEFEVTGTHFYADDDGNDASMPIGVVGRGIGVHDSAIGSGFIMYSEENVYNRFAASPPRGGGAEQMVAVRYNPAFENWQYSNNSRWVNFTPVDSDRLIAAVDYAADTIAGIEGYGGTVNGIHQGFFDSDLVFEANMWNGSFDTGEFQVTGSRFKLSGFSFDGGPLGGGVHGIDSATGTGYIMFSEQVVHDRFAATPLHPKAARNMVVVRLLGNTWVYSDDNSWNAFTPLASDRLMAFLDFDANSVTSLAGTGGNVNGIDSGFFDSDFRFRADSFNSSPDDGEFQIKGSSFIS